MLLRLFCLHCWGILKHNRFVSTSISKYISTNPLSLHVPNINFQNYILVIFCFYILKGSPYCYECSKDLWPNEKQNACVPKANEVLTMTDPLAIVLIILIFIGLVMTIIVSVIILQSRNLPDVKKKMHASDIFLLITLLGCFTLSTLYILKPTELICKLRETATIFCFTLTFVCVLSAMFRIYSFAQGEKWVCARARVCACACVRVFHNSKTMKPRGPIL